jgi:hypothetical protein
MRLHRGVRNVAVQIRLFGNILRELLALADIPGLPADFSGPGVLKEVIEDALVVERRFGNIVLGLD